jgi:hemolysin activation/secretion protein
MRTKTRSGGRLDFKDPSFAQIDSATAQTEGRYAKAGLNATRLQSLGNTTALFASLSGQIASKNLDSSEKLPLGGATGVRAFPQGEASGDEGVLLNVELRQAIKQALVPGAVEVIGFVDTGRVRINNSAYTTADNDRSLSGAGVGFAWTNTGAFRLRTDVSWKLGSAQPLTDADKSPRIWLQGMRFF